MPCLGNEMINENSNLGISHLLSSVPRPKLRSTRQSNLSKDSSRKPLLLYLGGPSLVTAYYKLLTTVCEEGRFPRACCKEHLKTDSNNVVLSRDTVGMSLSR